MRKLVVVGAISALVFISCNPTRERAGNRIKNFAADRDVMAEPGANVFKPKPKEAEEAVGWKKVKATVVEHYKLKYTLGNGDRIYVDEKRGMAKVMGHDGDPIAEGKIEIDKKTGFISIATLEKYEFDYIFNKEGFRAIVPKIGREK